MEKKEAEDNEEKRKQAGEDAKDSRSDKDVTEKDLGKEVKSN